MVKNTPVSAGDIREAGSITGTGRSPAGGNGNLLQHLTGKLHGQKSLGDYSPWGQKESDMTGHASWDLRTTLNSG